MSHMWNRSAYDPEAARVARSASKARKASALERASLELAVVGTSWTSGTSSGTIGTDGAANMTNDELSAWLALSVGQSMELGELTVTRV